jgi:F1F0 ATPase subunit 2
MTATGIQLLTAVVMGAGVGLFHFGGLWLTTRNLQCFRQPGLWLIVSFLLRTAVSILCFYLVMAGDWKRLLAALAGFTLIRLLIVRGKSGAPAV